MTEFNIAILPRPCQRLLKGCVCPLVVAQIL